MKTSQLKNNPRNPRKIEPAKLEKLVESIRTFPEMMEKRPMVCVTDVDGKLYPLGGNQRLKAIKQLDMKDIPDNWVMLADDWTEEQRQEFLIKDNVAVGTWDFDELKAGWDLDKLEEWGLDCDWNNEGESFNEQDYSDKNKEIDVDDFSDKMEMKFEFSSEEYQFIQTQLSYLSASKEEAILKVLKYEQSEI